MHYAYIIEFQLIKTYENYIFGRFLPIQGILWGDHMKMV
jgi:hypothetical protein